LFDPFASALGKVLSDICSKVIGMLASCVAEEANLFSVAATPFAEEEVDPQTNSLDQRQFSVESLRLKATSLLARGGQQRNRFGKRFHLIRLISYRHALRSSTLLSGATWNPYKHHRLMFELSSLKPLHNALFGSGRQGSVF
jgi:hypothetical protein